MSEPRGYVLDGIETAMQWSRGREFETVTCACGWERVIDAPEAARHHAYRHEREASLRFHYTHCSSAWGPVRLEP